MREDNEVDYDRKYLWELIRGFAALRANSICRKAGAPRQSEETRTKRRLQALFQPKCHINSVRGD